MGRSSIVSWRSRGGSRSNHLEEQCKATVNLPRTQNVTQMRSLDRQGLRKILWVGLGLQYPIMTQRNGSLGTVRLYSAPLRDSADFNEGQR